MGDAAKQPATEIPNQNNEQDMSYRSPSILSFSRLLYLTVTLTIESSSFYRSPLSVIGSGSGGYLSTRPDANREIGEIFILQEFYSWNVHRTEIHSNSSRSIVWCQTRGEVPYM